MTIVKNALFAIAAAITSGASAATITFNVPHMGKVQNEAGYSTTINGNLSIQIGSHQCAPSCADNGTIFYASEPSPGNNDPYISVYAQDGHAFTLGSFDGAEFPFSGQANFGWAAGIRVTGFLLDGRVVGEDFALDQFNDGSWSPLADFQTFEPTLSYAFKEIRFSGLLGNGYGFAIDNVVLEDYIAAEVPEPASLALFGLGLIALGARRKQAA
jgi:hypothetical protein